MISCGYLICIIVIFWTILGVAIASLSSKFNDMFTALSLGPLIWIGIIFAYIISVIKWRMVKKEKRGERPRFFSYE